MNDAKRALAARARLARQAAHAAGAEGAAGAVRDHLLACLAGGLAGGLGVAPGGAVAGYWPVGDELDTRPLMAALHDAGYVCALPVVTETNPVLVFRRWRRDDALAAGRYGIMEPHAGAATIDPDIVITPLLAFDEAGYRLGYGAGYYDRTLRR
ncbi:MAG: 5-formyltetrahydrofolate cyclo-ligase, partial [Alphaproteobacteria bacterium]